MKKIFNRSVDSSNFQKDVIVTFLTQVVKIVLSVATAAIVAQFLGPEGKGTLALALLVPGMLGIFLSGGIGLANVYFAGSQRLDVAALTANSVGITLLVTILGFGVVIGLAAFGLLQALVPGVPVWIVLVAMLGFPAGLLSGFLSSILQGLQRIVTVNLINLSQGVLTLALTLLFVIACKLEILGAVLAPVASGALSLIIFGILLHREGIVLTPSWSYPVLRSTLSFGLQGQIGNVLQFFNYRLDIFILNYFLGPANVGIYTVSVRLAELLWYLPDAVGFVIFPKAAATDSEEMNIFTPRVFRITLGLTALGALILAFVGRPVINFIFSSAFSGAYVPMLVLLPGVIFLGGAKVLANEIAGRGYPKYNSINAGLALVLTIVLDLVLIPRYAILGAALASTIAYTAIFFTAIGFYLTVSRGTKERSQVEVAAP
jgi:O-antigen/teichoic acid export membrane protein